VVIEPQGEDVEEPAVVIDSEQLNLF